MNSSVSFEWQRPLKLDSRLLPQLSETAADYGRSLISDRVVQLGLNPSEIRDADALEARSRKGGEIAVDLYTASIELRQFEGVRWSVTLEDNTKIVDLSANQVTSLANIGKQSVRDVSLEIGSILSIGFQDNTYQRPVRVRIRGTFLQIQNLRSNLETIFLLNSQPWLACEKRNDIPVNILHRPHINDDMGDIGLFGQPRWEED